MITKGLSEDDVRESSIRRLVTLSAAVFAVVVFVSSYTRWASFRYETFDLAFYVQALWKLSHGDTSSVSLLSVPLLGEHASVIVLLMVPLFALISHPMLPVAMQTLAIATMGPVGYGIARRNGLSPEPAGLMALAILLMPATGFVALHEFHPEAFTAPFLLLAIDGFQRKSLPRFWLWFLATLACKENMTLLLATWCGINALGALYQRHRDAARGLSVPTLREWLRQWCLPWTLLPACVALGWAVIYAGVLSPKWNGGNVDFTALYAYVPLGANGTGIDWKVLPHTVFTQLATSLRGTLLPGLLLPLCGLPLLRPLWLLVALPVLAQHYLSIRSSEWQITLHYSAPLIPLFWMAACDACAGLGHSLSKRALKALVLCVFVACLGGQAWFGPGNRLIQTPPDSNVAAQQAVIDSIPPTASVVAGMPYLSHLAERNELISLHLVLKGLKTLSRKVYQPPTPTDVVIADYADPSTFDSNAGYYHPDMRVLGGLLIPSSDRLLHSFLKQASWNVESRDSLTVLRRKVEGQSTEVKKTDASTDSKSIVSLVPGTNLLQMGVSLQPDRLLQVESIYRFKGERVLIPWMELRLIPEQPTDASGKRVRSIATMARGLCVPEGWDNGCLWTDVWTTTMATSLVPGAYKIEAVFFDNTTMSWAREHGSVSNVSLMGIVQLGSVELR